MSVRDHGGNLDQAMTRYGGARETWIDLSTGINPLPFPLPPISDHAWSALPTRAELAALADAARAVYGGRGEIVPVAGAQAAIQMVPLLRPAGSAHVLGPTYNEHAAALGAMGWNVRQCASLDSLSGADIAIVVNPNNPDGRCHDPDALMALSDHVGLLVIDESFCDPRPALSIAPMLDADTRHILVQRSFGKFFGLAGLRLGFALTGSALADRLRAMAGPWPVSGPAIAIGEKALKDTAWQARTIDRLTRDAARLDRLAMTADWKLIGGTALFRTYGTPDAAAAQDRLARAGIWSRIFPYSGTWLRLGLAGPEDHWRRLEQALSGG